MSFIWRNKYQFSNLFGHMKRTDEDTAFALEFGQELKRKYDKAKESGVSDSSFAESIGVVRGQLDRYLRGEAVPGVRTVALAFRNYAISVQYGGTAVTDALRKRRRGRKSLLDQLELPFTVLSNVAGSLDVKLKPVSARKFALQLIVRRAQ
jgi:transcriptional regulator with XRE-family HTH domain